MSYSHSDLAYPAHWKSRKAQFEPNPLNAIRPDFGLKMKRHVPENEFDESSRSWLLTKMRGAQVTYMSRSRDFSKNRITPITDYNLRHHDYIALSGDHYAPMIVMDFDSPSLHETLKNFPLAPNLVGFNQGLDHFGRMQAIWVLRYPVDKDDDTDEGIKKKLWLERVIKAMKGALSADTSFSNGLSRNPFLDEPGAEYLWEHYHRREYDLHELTKACELTGQQLERTSKLDALTASDKDNLVAGVYSGDRIGPDGDSKRYRPIRVSPHDENLVFRNCWVFLAVTELASRENRKQLTEEWVFDQVEQATDFLSEYLERNPNMYVADHRFGVREMRTIAQSIFNYWSGNNQRGVRSSVFTIGERSKGGTMNWLRNKVRMSTQLELCRRTSLVIRRKRRNARLREIAKLMGKAMSGVGIRERLNQLGMSSSRTTYWRDRMSLRTLGVRTLVEMMNLSASRVSLVETQVGALGGGAATGSIAEQYDHQNDQSGRVPLVT